MEQVGNLTDVFTHVVVVSLGVRAATVLCRDALAVNKNVVAVRAGADLRVGQTALLRPLWVGACGVAR